MASIREVSSSLPSPYPSSSSSNLHASAACQSRGQSPGDRCREVSASVSALSWQGQMTHHIFRLLLLQGFIPHQLIANEVQCFYSHLGIDDTFRNESESANGAWRLSTRWAGQLTFSVFSALPKLYHFYSLFSAHEHVGASDSLHFLLINSYRRAILEWGHYHFDLSQSTPQFEGSPH